MTRIAVVCLSLLLASCTTSRKHIASNSLQSDAAFARVVKAVLGENGLSGQIFTTALTDYKARLDYACRQPLFARYFQQRLKADVPVALCRSEIPFAVMTRYDGMKVIWLDPARVKSIHLLFGGKGQGMMSRFGHVALRLVVCPLGQTSADVCDANLSEHLVLGFQAHVNELSLDTFKGLSGQYKAYLFANPFMDAYEQYAIGDFREVYSLPLRLDDSRRETMVRELADIHWRYTGQYRFLDNNCATLLQEALRAVWPELAANPATATNYLRPDSFFKVMRTSILADGNKLSSLEFAEQNGFYFSSTRPFYDRALAEVMSHRQNPDAKTLEAYLAVEPVLRRQAIIDDVAYKSLLNTDAHVREAQIMLEEYAVLRSERLVMTEAAQYLEQQGFLVNGEKMATRLDDEHAQVFNDCLLKPLRQQFRPIRRLNGIPTIPEIVTGGETSACQSATAKALLQASIVMVSDTDSVYWQRLNAASRYWEQSITNVSFLKQPATAIGNHFTLGEIREQP